MKITLRPHHFLCLQGYKGQNYSKTQANSWSKISQKLEQNPDADILIAGSSDDLCKKCPALLKNEKSRCIEQSVNQLDSKVAEILDITKGEIYKYSEILEKIKKVFTKEKHEQLCSDCAWWIKGLCRDSFKK